MSMYKHYSDGRRRFLKMSALFGTSALISPAIARAEGGGADSPENGGFAASRNRTLGPTTAASLPRVSSASGFFMRPWSAE